MRPEDTLSTATTGSIASLDDVSMGHVFIGAGGRTMGTNFDATKRKMGKKIYAFLRTFVQFYAVFTHPVYAFTQFYAVFYAAA